MKVAFISNSISRRSAGVFEVEKNLAHHLIKKGVEINVLGLCDDYTDEDINLWQPLRPDVFDIKGPFKLGYAPGYYNKLKSYNVDLAHIHSIWKYPSYVTYRWSKKYDKPYITTLNGMLDSWAVKNSKLKKRLIWNLYERDALSNAACLQVNTEAEYESARAFGLKNPICIINNGISLDKPIVQLSPPWNEEIRSNRKILLFLGRLHPKKNPDRLLKAWLNVINKYPKESSAWDLVIVGFTGKTSYELGLKDYVARKALHNRAFIYDASYGEHMHACFNSADAFILPSSSEGAPIAVLTAWAYRLPTLITKECNLSDSFDLDASLSIEPKEKSIEHGMINLFKMEYANRKKIGDNAFKLASKHYSWHSISQSMIDVYKWILGIGPLPSTVVLD